MDGRKLLTISLPAALVTALVTVPLALSARARADGEKPRPVAVAWEEVESGPMRGEVTRARTPGGWLVRSMDRGGRGECLTYLPDPDHGWGRANPDLPEAQPR